MAEAHELPGEDTYAVEAIATVAGVTRIDLKAVWPWALTLGWNCDSWRMTEASHEHGNFAFVFSGLFMASACELDCAQFWMQPCWLFEKLSAQDSNLGLFGC